MPSRITVNPENNGQPETFDESIHNEVRVVDGDTFGNAKPGLDVRVSSSVSTVPYNGDTASLRVNRAVDLTSLYQFEGISGSANAIELTDPAQIKEVMDRFAMADQAPNISKIRANVRNGETIISFEYRTTSNLSAPRMAPTPDDAVFKNFQAAANKLAISHGDGRFDMLVGDSVRTDIANVTGTARTTPLDPLGQVDDIQVIGYSNASETRLKPGVASIRNAETGRINRPQISFVESVSEPGNLRLRVGPQGVTDLDSWLEQQRLLTNSLRSQGIDATFELDTPRGQDYLTVMREPEMLAGRDGIHRPTGNPNYQTLDQLAMNVAERGLDITIPETDRPKLAEALKASGVLGGEHIQPLADTFVPSAAPEALSPEAVRGQLAAREGRPIGRMDPSMSRPGEMGWNRSRMMGGRAPLNPHRPLQQIAAAAEVPSRPPLPEPAELQRLRSHVVNLAGDAAAERAQEDLRARIARDGISDAPEPRGRFASDGRGNMIDIGRRDRAAMDAMHDLAREGIAGRVVDGLNPYTPLELRAPEPTSAPERMLLAERPVPTSNMTGDEFRDIALGRDLPPLVDAPGVREPMFSTRAKMVGGGVAAAVVLGGYGVWETYRREDPKTRTVLGATGNMLASMPEGMVRGSGLEFAGRDNTKYAAGMGSTFLTGGLVQGTSWVDNTRARSEYSAVAAEKVTALLAQFLPAGGALNLQHTGPEIERLEYLLKQRAEGKTHVWMPTNIMSGNDMAVAMNGPSSLVESKPIDEAIDYLARIAVSKGITPDDVKAAYDNTFFNDRRIDAVMKTMPADWITGTGVTPTIYRELNDARDLTRESFTARERGDTKQADILYTQAREKILTWLDNTPGAGPDLSYKQYNRGLLFENPVVFAEAGMGKLFGFNGEMSHDFAVMDATITKYKINLDGLWGHAITPAELYQRLPQELKEQVNNDRAAAAAEAQEQQRVQLAARERSEAVAKAEEWKSAQGEEIVVSGQRSRSDLERRAAAIAKPDQLGTELVAAIDTGDGSVTAGELADYARDAGVTLKDEKGKQLSLKDLARKGLSTDTLAALEQFRVAMGTEASAGITASLKSENLFETADRDGDGKLTVGELRKFAQEAGIRDANDKPVDFASAQYASGLPQELLQKLRLSQNENDKGNARG